MRDIKKFENQQFGKIRAVRDGNRWLFCSHDVITALGYPTTSTSTIVKQRCREIVKLPDIVGHKKLPLNLIPEEDVYRILQRGRSPKVNAFKAWFESEILSSIHGYENLAIEENTPSHDVDMLLNDFDNITLTPDYLSKIATALKQSISRCKALEAQIAAQDKIIEDQKAMIEIAQKTSVSKNLIGIGEFAKVLRSENIDIGQNRLLKYLRRNGFLRNGDCPRQSYIDKGYFTVERTVVKTVNGTRISRQTYITEQGQLFLSEEIQKVFGHIEDN